MVRGRLLSPTPASDGEDEQNGSEDLTLDILAKARQRVPKREENGSPLAVLLSSPTPVEVVNLEVDGSGAGALGAQAQDSQLGTLEEGEITRDADDETPPLSEPATTGKKRKKKKKKKRKTDIGDLGDIKAQSDEDGEAVLTEEKPLEAADTLVMRKLLRGPRYFDPPEEQGEACYNCGKVGHRAAGCPEQPREKPCYVCGNFGHEGYDCPTECFVCGKVGHTAKLCPDKHSRIGGRYGTGCCLVCGAVAHDASKCFGGYDRQDFKQVRCYICKGVGHLCCVDIVDASPVPVSCYQCGDMGHSGTACVRQESNRQAYLCYKCGQEGHIARDCTPQNQRHHSWPAPWSAGKAHSPWKVHGHSEDVLTALEREERRDLKLEERKHKRFSYSTSDGLDVAPKGLKKKRKRRTEQVEKEISPTPKSRGSLATSKSRRDSQKRSHD